MNDFDDILLDKIDSTNLYARKHCRDFAADKITCVTAEEQTAGRGQFNRVWHSPRGQNIYATIVLRMPANTLRIARLRHIVAPSLIDILREEGLDAKVKWPNDVMINGKKLAGVLCELSSYANHIDLFFGIGININMEANELACIDQPATSLKIETGTSWDRKSLLRKFQKRFLFHLHESQHA